LFNGEEGQESQQKTKKKQQNKQPTTKKKKKQKLQWGENSQMNGAKSTAVETRSFT